ncbi:MAG: hypothetical protein ACD_29C00194G0003 [uncultured bacterium]|nr:MAG: hypothetical protein ACD_29C00194G0003 [uncultured bacterium]
MENLIKRWIEKIESIYDAFDSRKKIITIIGSCFFLFLVWYLFFNLFLGGFFIKTADLDVQQKQVALLKQQMQMYKEKETAEKNPALLTEEKNKAAELQKLINQINFSKNKLISSDKLSNGLRELLHENQGLNLISLASLPEEPIEPKSSTSLYRASFEMIVKGNYFQILKYLQQMEKYRAYVYWEEIKYKTIHYPDAEIYLKFYILTSKKGEKNEAKK